MVKNIAGVLLLSLLVLTACRKDEEHIDTCSNGIIDPGELGTDCGGPCPPCDEPTLPVRTYARVNGTPIDFANYELTYDTDWILSFSNDTISVVLNLGDGDSLGSRPIKPLYTNGETQLNKYPVLNDGRSLFTKIDKERNELSVLFEAKLTMSVSDPNYSSLDTMFVREAEFRNIPWQK